MAPNPIQFFSYVTISLFLYISYFTFSYFPIFLFSYFPILLFYYFTLLLPFYLGKSKILRRDFGLPLGSTLLHVFAARKAAQGPGFWDLGLLGCRVPRCLVLRVLGLWGLRV